MKEKVIKLIEETLKLNKGTINEDTMIRDISEWDSLGHIMIIGALQEQLNINIDLEEAIKIESVKDLFTKAGII